jgi:phosphoribosylanthranilate isomerase
VGVRIKVCCIASVEEARLAVEAGASALGLVSAMPSGPGVIDEETIARVARAAPPAVATFLLTCLADPGALVEQARRAGVSTIQICDRPAPGAYRALRESLPALKIVQVVHVTGEEAVAEAIAVAPEVDGILLDSGDPRRAVKELGGTGRRHDWSISARIRESVGVPLFLAGGLSADNAAEAVRTVRPYALDVCSGVRREGRLDRGRLAAFFAAASGAAS